MLGQSRTAKNAIALLRWLDQRNMAFVALLALSPFARLPSDVRAWLDVVLLCIAIPLCLRQVYRLAKCVSLRGRHDVGLRATHPPARGR